MSITGNYRNANERAMKRNEKGQFIKGVRNSKETEFKKGRHWREPKPYWDRDWLYQEYVVKQRSTGEIAEQFGVLDGNILYFMRKFNIPRRDISEARDLKHWGVTGEDNPMYGRTGEDNPNWRGGVTDDRQLVYASREWKRAVSKVWKRDNATCQNCDTHRDDVDEMHVHHIFSFSVVEIRTDIDNLVLLCKDCHNWIHSKDNTTSIFIGVE